MALAAVFAGFLGDGLAVLFTAFFFACVFAMVD
jgi:hypothetical protein